MKMQVNLPETTKRHQVKVINVEIENTEHGPEVILTSLIGEEIDRISLTKLYDHDETFEEMLEHECADCEESHCNDGNCRDLVEVRRVNDKIEELKHVFHQLENLLD